jgi:hypothetical protein
LAEICFGDPTKSISYFSEPKLFEMKLLRCSLELCALGSLISTVGAPDPTNDGFGTFRTSEALVLDEAEVIEEGEKRVFHSNRCQVKLQKDGNLLVKRLVAPNPYYQFYRVAWGSGPDNGPDSGGSYYTVLDGNDGSLLVKQRSPGEEDDDEHRVVYT